MRNRATVLWVLGLTLVITLVIYHGVGDIVRAIAIAGWGVLAVSMYSFFILVADTVAWRCLIPETTRPSLFTLLWTRWICGSINNLLPVIQIGGDFVRGRLIALRGVNGAVAGASVVVDITAAVLSQIIFSFIGLLFLVYHDGFGRTTVAAILGILVFTSLIIGFYAAQHFGLFRSLVHIFERLVKGESWKNLVGGAKSLDNAIKATYERRNDFFSACGWRFAGWAIGTGEVWLALAFLGHPVTLVEALILESLGQAVRSSAFMIPGAYGVQEGGFMLLGLTMGLSQETGLTLSLVKRVREVVVGLPALVVWQFVEQQQLNAKNKIPRVQRATSK